MSAVVEKGRGAQAPAPSRRAVLAGLPVLAATPLAFAEADVDAELLALIVRWRAARAHSNAIHATAAPNRAKDGAGVAAYELLMQVVDYPVRTLAGLAAKGRAYAEDMAFDLSPGWDGTGDTLDQLVLITVLRDAVRLAGRAQA